MGTVGTGSAAWLHSSHPGLTEIEGEARERCLADLLNYGLMQSEVMSDD